MAVFGQQFFRKVREICLQVLRDENVYNSQMYLDGTVKTVVDSKHVDVYINAATDATPSVSVAPHVGTLAVNDQVVILSRAPRDLIVLFKKPL